MGMAVVATNRPTCGANELDYFLVDQRIVAEAQWAELFEMGTSSHSGIRLWINSGFRAPLVRQMLAPKALPTLLERASGLESSVKLTQLRDKAQASSPTTLEAITEKYADVMAMVEEAILDRTEYSGVEREHFCGRGKAVKWKFKPLLCAAARQEERITECGKQAKILARVITSGACHGAQST